MHISDDILSDVECNDFLSSDDDEEKGHNTRKATENLHMGRKRKSRDPCDLNGTGRHCHWLGARGLRFC